MAKVLDLLLWALEARPSVSEDIIKTVSAVGEQNEVVHSKCVKIIETVEFIQEFGTL